MKRQMTLQRVGTAAGAALALLVSAHSAQAAPIFGSGQSTLEIVNAENVYRSDAACAAGGCLAFNAATDPAGYRRPDPSIANNILAGDLFIGVNNFRQIINLTSGLPTWDTDTTPIDNFTGYFMQEVKSVAIDFDGSTDRILLGSATVADPFGILTVGGADGTLATLSDNEMFRFFVDEGGTSYQTSGLGLTVAASIAAATDGLLWASLGVGLDAGTAAAPALDPDGYIYSEVQIGGGFPDFTGDFFGAFNILAQGPAYNLGRVNQVNDSGELLFGGALAGDPITTSLNNFTGVCVPTASYACNDLVGNGQLEFGGSITSPFTFNSEDPFTVNVPEPGILSLIGLGLIGMGLSTRRRKLMK